ncbi:hypothetical protein ACE6H2_017816 [Prunus campanulata]
MAIGPHEGTVDVERFHFHIADRSGVWQKQSERLQRAPHFEGRTPDAYFLAISCSLGLLSRLSGRHQPTKGRTPDAYFLAISCSLGLLSRLSGRHQPTNMIDKEYHDTNNVHHHLS